MMVFLFTQLINPDQSVFIPTHLFFFLLIQFMAPIFFECKSWLSIKGKTISLNGMVILKPHVFGSLSICFVSLSKFFVFVSIIS